MKWSFFGKKRLEFCGARSATASPKTPSEEAPPPAPLQPFHFARDRGPGSAFVGNKLCEDASDCSGEFLYQSFAGTARPALSLSLPVSPEERRLSLSSRPAEPEITFTDDDPPAKAEEEGEASEEGVLSDDGLPDTPCTVRSCPETEQVLGFCPNCQSVVVPVTKKRPRIRTNPWLWNGKRARLHASRHHGSHVSGGRSDGASIDALETAPKGVASERQGTATSVTDSGIFDASPTNSALEGGGREKAVAAIASRPSSVASCVSRGGAAGPPSAAVGPPAGSHPTWPRRELSDSSDSEETLAERREAERRMQRRRRRRKKHQRREGSEENAGTPPALLLFPRGRPAPAKGLPTPRPLCAWPPPQETPIFGSAEDPLSPTPAAREASPAFCLPQSDTHDLWEVRQSAPSPVGPGEEGEDDLADAEVREYSRRRVSAVRSGLRERIAQLRRDRLLLEQRLRAARDSQAASGQRTACWTREAVDYRKQLLLRLLSSARGQVDRHLDRLQDSYNALLAEKLAVEREAAVRRGEGGGPSPEEVL